MFMIIVINERLLSFIIYIELQLSGDVLMCVYLANYCFLIICTSYYIQIFEILDVYIKFWDMRLGF